MGYFQNLSARDRRLSLRKLKRGVQAILPSMKTLKLLMLGRVIRSAIHYPGVQRKVRALLCRSEGVCGDAE